MAANMLFIHSTLKYSISMAKDPKWYSLLFRIYPWFHSDGGLLFLLSFLPDFTVRIGFRQQSYLPHMIFLYMNPEEYRQIGKTNPLSFAPMVAYWLASMVQNMQNIKALMAS